MKQGYLPTKDVELAGTGLDDLAGDAIQPSLPAWSGRSFHPQVSSARRILPDGVFEAFFVALLRKHEGTLRT